MRNKRGSFRNQLSNNILYLIFFLLFFVMMLYFVLRFQNGVALWEEFYASEIARVINSAEPGSEVYLDVTFATGLAFKSGTRDFNRIFSFDNVNNKVIVRLKPNSGTSYEFFSDVDVADWRVEEVSGDIDTNRLIFYVEEGRG